MTPTLRFFWNGIKIGKGTLNRVFYTVGGLHGYHPETISIYPRFKTFSPGVLPLFAHGIFPDDSVTTYLGQEIVRVTPSHPLYRAVRAAVEERDRRLATNLKRAPKFKETKR